MCETMDDAEGTSVAKKLISELKESIRKSHRITEINSTIHTMRGSKGNERRILELLTERGNLELELCLTSAATKTFEELRRLAYDIGVGRAILEKILIGLGESLVLSERWEEGAHCFRECLEQFTGTDDCKLRVLERSAECHLYSNHGTSFEATHRVLHSFLVLSRKTGVLEKQEIALQFLVILSRRYGFGGKAAEYLAELEKVEELREHVRSQESQSQSQSFEGSSPIEDSSEANDASESDNDDHGDGATGRQSFVRAKRMNTGTVRQQTTITSLWPTANKLANNDASAVSKKGSDRNTERTRRRAVIEDEDEDDDDEDRDCHVSAELRHSTSPLPIRNGASNKENRGVPPAFAANDAETHKRRLRPRVSQFIAMSVGPSKIRASEDDSRSAVVASTTRHHSPSRPAYTTIADSDSDELPAIEELFGTKNRTTSGDEFDGVVVEVDEIDVSQTQEGALSRREAQKQVRPNMVTERRQQPGRRAKRRRIASASPPEIGAEIGDLPSNHVPSVESRCAEAAETEESMNAIPTTEALQNYMRPAEILPAAPSSEFNLRQEHDGAAAESVAVQSIAGSASQAHHPSNSPTFHRVPQDDGIESTLNVDDNPFLVSTPTPTAFIRHNRYTPTTPPSSRTHRSSSSLVADPPRAPLFPAAQASHPLPHRKRNKVRVQLPLPSTLSNTSSISDFGYETFAIPLPPASRTPPTISHIIHESKRRYKDIYKQSPPRILKWVTLCDDGIEEVVWEGDVWEGEGGLKGIRA
ncbi:hypothetical protein BC832DRAFT_547887 [Gaertneriomyces semiglobifer]|nr:hypothetical protein BC832DRAFT_547887 [Gaertneriomyces semiglobifer]